MSWVVVSASVSGDTGSMPYDRQRIRIVIPDEVKAQMIEGTESYMFLTYDAQTRVRIEAGKFKILDQRARNVGAGSGVIKNQGCVLLEAPGVNGIDDTTLLMVLDPTFSVGWRVAIVVMLGNHVSAKYVSYGTTVETEVPVDPAGGTPATTLFFGHESKPLSIDANATPVISVDDGGSKIDAYTWSTAVVSGVSGGPWFSTAVTASVPPPPKEPYVRPPPVDADTFWAYPACCECGDFFLINNDILAQTWDVEGSIALDLSETGDSVIFNHTDADGTRWSITEVENWWTLPPPELPDLPQSGYLDGSFPVDGRYNYRTFKVTGVFLPGPDVSAAVPRQRLLRALDAVRGGALWVAKEPVWAKQSWVYLAEQPDIVTTKASRLTNFEFSLKAVDPIKYHAGTVGFQQVQLLEASSGYEKRTYSVDTISVAATGTFNWSAATAVAAPANGTASSTCAFFDDTTQTVCVSAIDKMNAVVDLSSVKVGYPFVVEGSAGEKLDGVVISVTNNTTWWAVEVGNAPLGASTHSKPAAGAAVVGSWYLPGTVYAPEAVQWGMRFRPLPDDTDANPDNDTDDLGKDLTLAPNPWRRYQVGAVVPATVTAINAGTTKVMPRVYIYGPCSNPIVVNNTTKEKMQFVGDVLQGELLVADCYWRILSLRSATIPPSNDPRGDLVGFNRRWMLDFTSQWLSVAPGENVFTMSSSSLDPSSRVVIAFRSGWLG